ncbi:ABC transporter ATP-binding protein [Ancylobacter dichloromethanicus]|uniref:Iron ABC transporter ATP-binding protein n=1 Tax=Ancylobacter dichloromethanicus TaxID=518825 RepID=A0A9W6MZJ6_9HYPH|nr:ABC transporter ATP-binding protein [Ancylobacter dichloromethanicus]MBS7555162.1 ABC transporter ATP-binding protein [Ancylobacter dichloromethanicus]GLK72208.1 iron ABC transporter ATP-binding protein [Ancylobacter dichloromethanicus]
MAPRLAIEGLSVGYGRRRIIEDLTLPAISGGGVTALIGPNAAGKTTLLRALAGLVPARGSIRLDDTELTGLSVAGHARHVTYMPQALPQRVALTVFEATLSALMSARDETLSTAGAQARAFATLERLGIADLALRGLDELSGGQRQLASLAQSIVREPTVLLLDEPTSALDIHHQMRVMQLVEELARERSIIVIIVLHDIAQAARYARRIVVLERGAVAADGPPGAAITPETLARVYRVEARVERCSQGFLQVIVDRAV